MVDFGSRFSKLEVWAEGLGHFGLLLSASGARVAISLVPVSFFERWSCQPQARTSRLNLYPQGGGSNITWFRSWILLPSCKRLYATNALNRDPKIAPFWCFCEGPCESGNYAPARTGTLLTTFSGIKKRSKNNVQKTLAKKHVILRKYIENGLKLWSRWPRNFDVFSAQSIQELEQWAVKGPKVFQTSLKLQN